MKRNCSLLKIILLMPAVLTAGCGGSSPSSAGSSLKPSSIEVSSKDVSSPIVSSSEIVSSSSQEPASRKNPIVIELEDIKKATLTDLEGPYVILDQEGEAAKITLDGTGVKRDDLPNEYDNMYEAIRVAGTNSTSKNVLQVQDTHYVQIYKKAKKSQCYVFDGPKYVGTAGQTTSRSYCLEHPEAYAVDGAAADYFYLGRHDMVENQTVQENVLETFAGAYNYMFSKGGSGAKDLGYRYCTADVLLSEAAYAPTEDGTGWNAYIFINMSEGILADLGLIGIKRATRVEWCLVRNCSSKMHTAGTSGVEKDAKFYVWQDKVVTYSTKYDSSTGEYSGFDDLHFEAFTLNDGWILNITNLRTKQVYTIQDRHVDSEGKPLEENTEGISGRALIAASYCPVVGNVWNWDCGACLNNVIWTNISMKKAIKNDNIISNDIEDYRVLEQSYELYPGSDTYRDGYSQGGYRSYHLYSKFEQDGKLSSGYSFLKNQKFISFSVDYRNSK